MGKRASLMRPSPERSFPAFCGRSGRTASPASPVTGRTHQLRLHCAYMGFPILGDPQYGSEASLSFSRERDFETQLLLAKRLEFIHPITGEAMVLESHLTLPEFM